MRQSAIAEEEFEFRDDVLDRRDAEEDEEENEGAEFDE